LGASPRATSALRGKGAACMLGCCHVSWSLRCSSQPLALLQCSVHDVRGFELAAMGQQDEATASDQLPKLLQAPATGEWHQSLPCYRLGEGATCTPCVSCYRTVNVEVLVTSWTGVRRGVCT
jgi:hypothetical protein